MSCRRAIAGRRKSLRRKVARYRPRFVAVVGIDAFRKAFGRPKAKLGLQPETIGPTRIWLLPNPSGLNANYQLADFAKAFGAGCRAAEESG